MRECPSIETLESAVTDPQSADGVHRHLALCDECRRRADEILANHEIVERFRGMNRNRLVSALTGLGESGVGRLEGVPGYELLDAVGRGGQGVVYRAVHQATKRTVALKMTHPERCATPRQQRRFEREIELVAGLRHPHIVTLYDSGITADGRHYFSMEFVDGIPLDEWVNNALRRDMHQPDDGKPLPLGPHPRPDTRSMLRLMVKICAAVQYAHQRGIIHRDLKPSNILVDVAGEPHVLDFGLAKVAETERISAASRVTQAGAFMGTMDFAAPEQVQGDPDQIDTRTDVYALGVILYGVLTNEAPYSTQGPLLQAARTIIETEPLAPSQVNPAVDDELDAITLKALAKEMERRYTSAGALGEDLERYLAGLPISARRDSTWYVVKKAMRRHRRLTVGAAASLILVTGAAIVMTVLAQRLAWERDRADQTAQGLRESLRVQQIAAGRDAGISGNVPVAEDLLWGAHLQPLARDEQPREDPSGTQRRLPSSYWALWELYSRHPCRATWLAHEDGVVSLYFEPSDGTLISVGAGSLIRFWSVPACKLSSELDLSPHTVRAATVSQAGQLLAVGTSDGNIGLWDLQTRDWVANLPGSDEAIMCLAFDSAGARLASGLTGGTVLIWDLARRSVERSILTHNGPREISFSPDGSRLASAHGKEGAHIWQVATGERIASANDDWCIPTTIQFDPQGRNLAVAGDGPLQWWDPQTGTLTFVQSGLRTPINAVRFSADGSRFACGGYDQIVRQWTISDDGLEGGISLAGHRVVLAALALSSDGKWIATGSRDGVIKLWDSALDGHRSSCPDVDFSVHSLQFSPDGQDLTASGGDRNMVSRVRVWDVALGAVLALRGNHNEVASSSSFIPEQVGSRMMATTGFDGTIKFWDIDQGRGVATLQTGSAHVSTLAVSPDGRLLAAASGDSTPVGRVELWDIDSRRRIHTFESHRSRVPHVCFSPDGQSLASSGIDGRIVVNTVESRESRVLCSGGPGIRALCISRDGQTVYSGNNEGLIQAWDLNSSILRKQWIAHFHRIYALAPHPSGNLLASAGVDGYVRLWDPVDGQLLATLIGHNEAVFSLSFHPQGRLLASGGSDQNVFLWHLDYFEQHIAGNLEYQISRLPADSKNQIRVQELRDWAAGVLARDDSESWNTSR